MEFTEFTDMYGRKIRKGAGQNGTIAVNCYTDGDVNTNGYQMLRPSTTGGAVFTKAVSVQLTARELDALTSRFNQIAVKSGRVTSGHTVNGIVPLHGMIRPAGGS